MVVVLLTWKYLLSPCRSNIIITHQRKGGLWVGVWPSVSSSLDCKSKCLYSSRIVMITQFFWVAVMKDLAYNVFSWSNFNLSWKGYKGWIGKSFYVENWDKIWEWALQGFHKWVWCDKALLSSKWVWSERPAWFSLLMMLVILSKRESSVWAFNFTSIAFHNWVIVDNTTWKQACELGVRFQLDLHCSVVSVLVLQVLQSVRNCLPYPNSLNQQFLTVHTEGKLSNDLL